LKGYYKNARLVVYPSLYEGFGLPPLEAMASGAPVVTSYTSSIPEVVGDASLMIDPKQKGQLVHAMYRVLSEDKLADRLRAAGKKQVMKFNWYRVARGVLSVYYEVYQKNERMPLTVQSFMPRELWRKLCRDEAKYISTAQKQNLFDRKD
jgi:glycosyltransferase involved in cell wall biosynthesis